MTDYYDEDYSGILDGPSVREMLAKELRRGRSPRDTTADQGDNEERGDNERLAEIAARTRATRLERDLAQLMTQTRRSLAEALLAAREHASHPYIARLERENAALRTALQEIIDFSVHDVDPLEIAHAALAVGKEGGV